MNGMAWWKEVHVKPETASEKGGYLREGLTENALEK